MNSSFEESGAFSLLEKRYPTVPRGTWSALQSYVTLVFEWNNKTNLTGAHTPRDFILQHVADCMGASFALPRFTHWLDVGTGAGLPGLIWAILNPTQPYFLLDASMKRCAFLRRVQVEIGLAHVKIFTQRFESLRDEGLELNLDKFSLALVSRGTSAPSDLLKLAIQTELHWKAWYVFSNSKIHSEYLTLAPPLGVEISSISYPRNAELSTAPEGILTCLRKI